MTPERGEYLIAFETRLSTIVRILSASPMTSAGASFVSNVIMRANAASLCSFTTRPTRSGRSTGPTACGSIARVW